MDHFIGIDADMPAYGRALRTHDRAAAEARRARLKPLPERVADAMREIAAVRGSCDLADLELRFPGEDLTDQVIAQAKKLAGRRSDVRVA